VMLRISDAELASRYSRLGWGRNRRLLFDPMAGLRVGLTEFSTDLDNLARHWLSLLK
jgi:hypothetical protein